MSEDVDQEALQRITELRVRLLKERLQAEQQEPDEQRWQQHEIEQKRIREHHEHLRLMIESKQQLRKGKDTEETRPFQGASFGLSIYNCRFI